jgi:hypothetical protein
MKIFFRTYGGVSNGSEAVAAVGCLGTHKIRLTRSATVWDQSGAAAGCSCHVAAAVSAATGAYRGGAGIGAYGSVVTVLAGAGSRTAPVSSMVTALAAARAARDAR